MGRRLRTALGDQYATLVLDTALSQQRCKMRDCLAPVFDNIAAVQIQHRDGGFALFREMPNRPVQSEAQVEYRIMMARVEHQRVFDVV